MTDFDSFDDLDAQILEFIHDFEVFARGRRGPTLAEISEDVVANRSTVLNRLKKLADAALVVRRDEKHPTYTSTPEGRRFAVLWRRLPRNI